MAELIFLRRGDEVLRFAVDRPRILLGRGERNDVVIPDPEVSRQQAALFIEDGQVLLEDLSGRGTWVAGEPVQKTRLSDGADIALGQWRAIFRQRESVPDTRPENATEVRGTVTAPQPADSSAERFQPAQLRIRIGESEEVLPFKGDQLTLGSDASNDVVLKDRFISSRHLRLARRGSLFQVVDPGSTNGTFFGSVRVFEAVVPLHSTLRLGSTELTLEPLTQNKEKPAFEGIIGNDASVRQLCELIERVSPSNAAVAVFGESGTGKELVAHAVHARSTRAGKPFIPVNCAAISKELIESELFGHEKGSFTGAATARKGAFEEADGGTLFLDEIGELPLDLQAKLLRALESGEIKRVGASRPLNVDVRIVAATNKDLLAEAREGRFREDLYYRLCVVPLHLPPLRNRKGDLPTLAEHFVQRFSPRGQTVKLTPAAVERLKGHRWPGNIRELRNVVHRALLLRRGPMIDAGDVTFDQETDAETGMALPELVPGQTLEQMLEKVERQIVETALRKFDNNKERVAKELGVARSTLFKRLKEWGLTGTQED
jgi:DNA-binding NtrC family response regulator